MAATRWVRRLCGGSEAGDEASAPTTTAPKTWSSDAVWKNWVRLCNRSITHSGTKKLMHENNKTKIRGRRELLLLFEIVLRKLCTDIGSTSNFLLFNKSGVKTGDSRDALGRSRFHCFNPETHLHGGYPDWYYQYDKYGAKKVWRK